MFSRKGSPKTLCPVASQRPAEPWRLDPVPILLRCNLHSLRIMNRSKRKPTPYQRKHSGPSRSGAQLSRRGPRAGTCSADVSRLQQQLDPSVADGRWEPPRGGGPAPRPTWLSLQEVCEALGLSRWTIRKMVVNGKLKPGIHHRYWFVQPDQPRPKTQYCLEEIEKEVCRKSRGHRRRRPGKSS
jgi:hypothetical protein